MPGDSLKLGEIVTAEYTVWSSENRSFVRLDAFREASFEPCEQLSGPFAFKAYGAYRKFRCAWWPKSTDTGYVLGTFSCPVSII